MHFNTWETSEEIFFRADQMNCEISRSAPLPTTCDKIILSMDNVLK